MKNFKSIKILFAWVCSSLIVLSVLYYFGFLTSTIHYVENNFASDNKIEDSTKLLITLCFFILVGSLIFFLLLTIKGVRNYFYSGINKIFNIQLIWSFLIFDDLTKRRIGTTSLFVSVFGTLIMTFSFMIFGEPKPEGLIEIGSSFGFLLSAIFLLISMFKLKSNAKFYEKKNLVYYGLLSLALFQLFIFGEEFSWGQRILGLESHELFQLYNYQQETTFHNFFNPLFPAVYPLFAVLLLNLTFFLTFFPSFPSSPILKLFRPHASHFFLLLMICCISFKFQTEPFEEMFSFFSVMYSLRIFICIIWPSETT